MRSVVTLIGVAAIVGLMAVPAFAQNTLFDQEGDLAKDGYTPINGKTIGAPPPIANPRSTNWMRQGGSGTWSGVYSWDSNAWMEEVETGDSQLDIECDIEMFCEETILNHKIYFHIGNLYSATEADLTATCTGTLKSNNGQWIGISFAGTLKDDADFETGGPTGYTGRIFGAMVGTTDAGGRNITTALGYAPFDVKILLSYTGSGSSGGFVSPDSFGEGAHGSITKALWWLINSGNPGLYNLTWKVQLYPGSHQVDGNYHLDPTIVAAPVL